MKEYIDFLTQWIKTEVKNSNKKGVILVLDKTENSKILAFLAKKAFPNNSLALILPIDAINEDDRKEMTNLLEKIKLDFNEIDLTIPYLSFENILTFDNEKSREKIKEKIRSSVLDGIALEMSYIILNPANLYDYFLGLFTNYQIDRESLAPLAKLNPNEIHLLAKNLEILDNPNNLNLNNLYNIEEYNFNFNDLENFLNNESVLANIKYEIEMVHSLTELKRIFVKIPNRNWKEK
ncbi:nH(3)-dependent NAD+ synthetase [[Mycoplasma] mobile]|uniref:NH(3)-dependent NAD(+) synthetase n=1 Tax=Mycoplasma mobile (strain ATCC 43663 / 163K / NCTC 11711) TaxID=267748 RepID=Q6KI98_MYCM1|nr:nH(3)-dependent NAD+ synthetase [[Mycoplasma] mobile]AAT27678.1 NH(3)-dependent NAD(+) synthetase [Mycoplasma mobile 163K]